MPETQKSRRPERVPPDQASQKVASAGGETPSLFEETLPRPPQVSERHVADIPVANVPVPFSLSASRAARLRRVARNGNRVVLLLEALYRDLVEEAPERFRGLDRAEGRIFDARSHYRDAHERASFFAKANAEYAEKTLRRAGEPVVIERAKRTKSETSAPTGAAPRERTLAEQLAESGVEPNVPESGEEKNPGSITNL